MFCHANLMISFTLNKYVVGICCNVAVLTLFQASVYLCKKFKLSTTSLTRPAWDSPKLERFGEAKLDSELMWFMMKGVKEPFLERYFIPLVLVLLIAMLPLTGDGLPALTADGQLESMPNIVAGKFLSRRLVVYLDWYPILSCFVLATNCHFLSLMFKGLPDWAFSYLMFVVLLTVIT